MNKQQQKLKTAISAMVDFFSDKTEYQTKDGEVKEWNRLGFAQFKAIDGLLFGLHRALDYNENVRMPRLKDAYDQCHKGDTLTEIGKRNLGEVVRKAQECSDQNISMQSFIEVAEAVYTEVTGKTYVYRGGINTKAEAGVPSDAELSDLEENARALFYMMK